MGKTLECIYTLGLSRREWHEGSQEHHGNRQAREKWSNIPRGARSTLCLSCLWRSLRSCSMCVVWCKCSSKFPCCSAATCRYPEAVEELCMWTEDCAGRVAGYWVRSWKLHEKSSSSSLIVSVIPEGLTKPLRTPNESLLPLGGKQWTRHNDYN